MKRFIHVTYAVLLTGAVFFAGIAFGAYAQERPARTWAGGGLTVSKSTDNKPVVTGVYVDLAYDLRHGLQLRGIGEYRSDPAIPNLFGVRGKSELRYGAELTYHFKDTGKVQPFVASGVQTIRLFFEPKDVLDCRKCGDYVYNSSVNPTITVGVGFPSVNTEASFTKYLGDTYSYSKLNGFGYNINSTRALKERLRAHYGIRVRVWNYRSRYSDKRVGEVAFTIGVRFQ